MPLLDVMGERRTIAKLRAAFELVTVCWNLPVWEQGFHAFWFYPFGAKPESLEQRAMAARQHC